MQKKITSSPHYNSDYFDWQKTKGGGGFGGWAEPHKFFQYISMDAVVIDFGCGGGFLLDRLKCREKIGIEPNPAAAISVKNLGILHFFSPQDAIQHLGENYADVIISNHALEHTLNPLDELLSLKVLLKKGGKIIFYVPCEGVNCRYIDSNIDRHLYTWSPLNLGNLFNEAGFSVVLCKAYLHKWPPFYNFFSKFGWKFFNLLCRMHGFVSRSSSQVIILATKP